MNGAQYAGDDYRVKLTGLDPFDPDLEFLPWANVEGDWVHPTGELSTPRHAASSLEHHPPGTALHENKGLAGRVDDHFAEYGTSVKNVADKLEDTVRTADEFSVNYGGGWYAHEAGSAVRRLVRQGYERHQAAHLIADLSPQNNWLGTPNHPELGNREEAVRYGREAMDMRHQRGKYDGGVLYVPDHVAQAAHDNFGASSLLRPGRYDISHEDPNQWEIGPKEMSELPQFHSRATRTTRSAGIATALGIRHSDDLGPKTWPFHHNILEPHSSPYATIDTHMVDAGGVAVPQAEKTSFLSSVRGVAGEKKNIPVYRGYGQVGMASATIEATRRLNAKPEEWMKSQPPLLPLHTQAITWTEHLTRKKPVFRRNIEPLKGVPLGDAFGYNFGHPQAY